MEQDARCGGTQVAVSQAGHNGIGHMSLNLRHVQEPTTAMPLYMNVCAVCTVTGPPGLHDHEYWLF